MKRASVILATSFLALGLAALAIANPKDETTAAPSVTGTWKCTSHGGQNGDLPFTLELEQDGQNVTGSVSSSLGDADISQASFKDGKLEIEIDTGDDNYVLTATLEKDGLKGQWTHGQDKGTWEGMKGASESQHPAQTQ
jgi:hypothetical protein